MTAIEVFADIWCPFAHVGLRTLVARRDELGRHDVAIRVKAWPLELVNGEPLDPATTARHVGELQAQVAPGLFARFEVDRFPRTSLPGLGLAAAAYRRSDRVGEEVSLAVRNALFEEGRDVSLPAVLDALAEAHGVDRGGAADDDEVRRQWHEGQRRGVQGSPHFFCGDADIFCPSLQISRDEGGALHVERDVAALDAFLRRCLGGEGAS